MSEQLTFIAATHTYKLEPSGEVLPSVSEVISPLVDLSGIPSATLAFASARGVAVHKACELYDLGELDMDSLDPLWLPYLQGWIKFTIEHEPEWYEIEVPQWNRELRYAGTPDRRGLIKGRRKLVDIKATYALGPAVQVQLTGYDMMTPEPCDDLLSVRLCKDGTYELKQHEPARPTFLSCLNIMRWKARNGVKTCRP